VTVPVNSSEMLPFEVAPEGTIITEATLVKVKTKSPTDNVNVNGPKVVWRVRVLGHGLIMSEPEADRSELEHGEEVGSVLFVARGDAAAMFDLVEEPLDAVALAI